MKYIRYLLLGLVLFGNSAIYPGSLKEVKSQKNIRNYLNYMRYYLSKPVSQVSSGVCMLGSSIVLGLAAHGIKTDDYDADKNKFVYGFTGASAISGVVGIKLLYNGLKKYKELYIK